MLVDVVMPNFSQVTLLEDSIRSIKRFSNCGRVVVVNDHGPLKARRALRLSSRRLGFAFLENRKNLGFAFTVNRGLRVAQSEIVLLLNDDTLAKENFFLPALKEFNDPDVAVVGCRLLYPDGKIQFGGIIQNEKKPLWFEHRFRGLPGDFWAANRRSETWAVTGACMFLRKSVLEKVDYFDENFFLGFEDLDLCLRIGELGKKIIYQPRAWLFHKEGASRGPNFKSEKEMASLRLFWKKWGKKLQTRKDIAPFGVGENRVGKS